MEKAHTRREHTEEYLIKRGHENAALPRRDTAVPCAQRDACVWCAGVRVWLCSWIFNQLTK